MLLEHDSVASTESFLWWGTQRCLLASSLNTAQKSNPPGIGTPPPGLNLHYLPPSATRNTCNGMSWVGRWVSWRVGVVEMVERWQILLEPQVCHTFQPEENKSICEAATGADRTFCERSVFPLFLRRSVCACVRAHQCVGVCVFVWVCLPEPFWCLAGQFNRCFCCHWLTQLVII